VTKDKKVVRGCCGCGCLGHQVERLHHCLETVIEKLWMCLSSCVGDLKCRPMLHRCVVIFFWSSGIMDCMLIWFTKSFAHTLNGRSWCDIFKCHWRTALNTWGCFFRMQAMLLEDSFSQNYYGEIVLLCVLSYCLFCFNCVYWNSWYTVEAHVLFNALMVLALQYLLFLITKL